MKGITDVHACAHPLLGRGLVRGYARHHGWEHDAHRFAQLTEKIEKKVHSILPKSDVTVHVEPLEKAES